MMVTKSVAHNYTIDDTGTRLQFTCRHAPAWWLFIFDVWLVVLGVFWSIGSTLDQSLNAQWPIFALSLSIGALLVAMGISDSLWQLIGREQLQVSSTQIGLRHRLAGLGFAMTFNASQIGAVFVSHEQPGWYLALRGYGMHYLDFKGGRVAINTGKNLFGVVTHRFGSSLHPDEAHEIVEMLLTRFPQYEYGPLRLS